MVEHFPLPSPLKSLVFFIDALIFLDVISGFFLAREGILFDNELDELTNSAPGCSQSIRSFSAHPRLFNGVSFYSVEVFQCNMQGSVSFF